MAVQLFLDSKEVVIDSTQEIKITKENPYFTLSDSYTLDVSIPLDIPQNRQLFGNLQRIDVSKSYRKYDCKMFCENVLVMNGEARIVQSTEKLVKVQLACGVSALKMSGEQEDTYIDAMLTEKQGRLVAAITNSLDSGATIGDNHTGYCPVLLDSTSGTVMNLGTLDGIIGRGFPYISECPRLVDVARLVANKLGYTIDMSCLPEACGKIYVATAIQGNVSRKLPHWTVKEFFTQFQNFFGCTLISSGTNSLKLVSLGEYAGNAVTSVEPVAEFQVDYSEEDDADGVMNSNIEFEMESASIEIVDEELLAQAQYTAEYSDDGAMENAFRNDAANVKMHKLYKVGGETHIGWEKDDGTYELRRIAPFNPLVRFEGADSVKLKIAPAYMEEDVECQIAYMYDIMGGIEQQSFVLTMPSVSNPFGVKAYYGTPAAGGSDSDAPTLQSLVEGSETVTSDSDKSDVMSVVFVDGNEETVKSHGPVDTRQGNFSIHLAFTDYSFKQQLSNKRRKWSFSLNELAGYEFYLGQLHKLTFSCSHKVKHIIKFVSPSIPEPTDIFLIHGKRFACEKIEANIRDGQLDQLMTGYFYEML